MPARTGHWAFLRMLSGAVAVQAVLSASNFAVGLLLVRRTTEVQYGYYVLITTAILLATTLQGAFIQPPMVVRLTRSTKTQRADFIGGLYKDQRRLIMVTPIFMVTAVIILTLRGRITWQLLAILVFGSTAVLAALRREFFRMVLFAYRQPAEVLRSDFVYCIFLVGGAFGATLMPSPAAAAAMTLGLSAFIGGSLLSKALWRHEPWNPHVRAGMLKEIAHDGGWSAFGGGVHWLFNQGYTYLVAATINVSAVAALSATRLFITPVSLLSVGIGTLMLPTASKWNNAHRAIAVLRRLALFAVALDVLASIYFLMVWHARSWIFGHVLKRHFPQGDQLLLVWFAIALVTVFRDQLLYFLTTRSRFKITSALTTISAVISLTISFVLIHRIGAVGASLGLLIGEIVNTIGILLLSLLEARRTPSSLFPSAATSPPQIEVP